MGSQKAPQSQLQSLLAVERKSEFPSTMESSPLQQAEIPLEQQPEEQGQTLAKEREYERKQTGTKTKRTSSNFHISLPGLESYQKEICFAAEAPGRVVVRLERIMGSDKIRPVDSRYMETLIQRLEEEEAIEWNRRNKLRKKAEKERFRQMAIAGVMEPGPGMEDLYNHPVFRVNRILKRLNKMDYRFTSYVRKMPPIEKIEPFEKDDTGAYFKTYPYHKQLSRECAQYKRSHPESKSKQQMKVELEELEKLLSSKYSSYREFIASAPAVSKSHHAATGTTSKTYDAATEDEDEEQDEELLEAGKPSDTTNERGQNVTLVGEGFGEEHKKLGGTMSSRREEKKGEEDDLDAVIRALHGDLLESLESLQQKYGVPLSSDFEDQWKPYRSELVEKIFSDYESMDELYEAGANVLEQYTGELTESQIDEFTKAPENEEDDEEDEEDDEEDEEEDEELLEEGDVAFDKTGMSESVIKASTVPSGSTVIEE